MNTTALDLAEPFEHAPVQFRQRRTSEPAAAQAPFAEAQTRDDVCCPDCWIDFPAAARPVKIVLPLTRERLEAVLYLVLVASLAFALGLFFVAL
ncbi:MAG TPA: hypothetical protein VI454_07825 [Verrucomicrobiae bacterium]